MNIYYHYAEIKKYVQPLRAICCSHDFKNVALFVYLCFCKYCEYVAWTFAYVGNCMHMCWVYMGVKYVFFIKLPIFVQKWVLNIALLLFLLLFLQFY